MTSLTLQGVAKSFGTVAAVAGVDLTVESGSTTALLGPSGCGKTTLLRIIAGFERPDVGTVSTDGEVLTGPSQWVPPERRSIGYVAQEGALFPHLTVRGNIEFALDRRERRERGRVQQLLALVQLDDEHLRRYPHQLSGGQQQRVALARALARRPALVLLDEPFAALDAGLRAETRDLVATALAEEGVTTLLVTHDQEEALSFADQVVVMRAGRVQQAGAPRRLYTTPHDAWTAAFLGDAVLLPAEVAGALARCALGVLPTVGAKVDGNTTVMLRPEQIRLRPIDSRRGAADDSGKADPVGGGPVGSGPVDVGSVGVVGSVGAGFVGAGPVGVVKAASYRGHETVVDVALLDRPDLQILCRVPGVTPWMVPGVRVEVSVVGSAVAFAETVDSAR